MLELKNNMKCKVPGNIVDVVITGMPGVGKSQLLCSYVKNNEKLYTNILWIDATSDSSILQSFVKLAKRCNLLQKFEKNIEIDIVKKVYDFFTMRGDTLFLFDNASTTCLDYITQNTLEYPDIYFIFTSTCTDWEKEPQVKKVIKLGEFTPVESAELLNKKLNKLVHYQEDIENLGKILGFLPLALELASAYIIENAKSTSEETNHIRSYIETIQDSMHNPQQGEDILPNLNSVWMPTLQKIKSIGGDIKRNGSSKDGKIAMILLRIISLLEPNGIPTKLFLLGKNPRKTSEILNILKRYSVISFQESYINIHSLLQNLIRVTDYTPEEDQYAIKYGIELFNKQIAKSNTYYSDRDFPSDCSLHAVKLLRHSLKHPELISDNPDLPLRVILALNSDFNSNLSADFGKEIQAIFDSKETLSNSCIELKATLADTKIRKGLYEEALKDLDGLLVKDENWIKANILTMGLVYHIKAFALLKLGNFTESLIWHEELIKVRDKIYPEDHPHLLASKHNMAGVLSELGRNDDALQIYFENVDKMSKKYEQNSYKKMLTLCEISRILHKKGLITESKEMLDTAIQGLEEYFGKLHPQVLSEKHNRVLLLDDLGSPNANLIKECYEIYEDKCKLNGKNHPSTQQTAELIAKFYQRMGSYEDSKHLYEEVLVSLEKTLGKYHPTVLTTKYNGTMILERQGKYEEALAMYLDINSDACIKLGPDHSLSLDSRERIAYCLFMMKNNIESLAIYDEIIALRIEKFTSKHPDLQVTRHNRAMVLNFMGRNDEALSEFMDIVSVDEENYGTDHPFTLRSKERIANILRETGNLQEAKIIFDDILPKMKRHLGSQDQDVVAARVNRARVLKDMGKPLSAMKVYLKCKDIFCNTIGEGHYLTTAVNDLISEIEYQLIFGNAAESEEDTGDISD